MVFFHECLIFLVRILEIDKKSRSINFYLKPIQTDANRTGHQAAIEQRPKNDEKNLSNIENAFPPENASIK